MKLRAVALLLVASAFGDAGQRSVEPRALYDQALLAYNRGQYPHARQLAEEGMQRFGQALPWNELFACVKAEALSRGSPADAVAFLTPIPSSGDPEATVRRRMARGYLLALADKDYAAAAEEYRKAAILAARFAPELQPEIAIRRAAPAFYADDFEQIESFSREALKLAALKHQPFVYANALGMLAAASFKRRDYPQAIERSEPALKFARAVGSSAESKITGNLGWSYMQLGDAESARTSYQEALAYAEAQGDLISQSTWLANIANVYVTEQQFATALPYAQRAEQIARHTNNPERLASTLVNLADVEIELGRYADARTHNDEALRVAEETKKGYARLNAARIAAATHPDEALGMYARLAASKNDATLRWHAQFFMAALYQDLGRQDEARRAYEAALEIADDARVQSSSDAAYLFAFESLLIRFYDRYIDLLRDDPRAALRVAERSHARTLRDGIGFKTTAVDSPEAVARAHGAAILLYWLQPDHSLLWVVTPAGVFLERLRPAAEIENALAAYRREILDKDDGLQSRHAAALFEMLVRPALKHTNSTRYIVVPDARMSVSLESLVVAKPRPHYWIEDATVSYAPALWFLPTTIQHRPFFDARALLIGDVPERGTGFPPLPYAGREIARVARYFNHPEVVTGEKATPAAYLTANLSQLSYLHFAAHATANVRSPLGSAVILAGGQRLSGEAITKAPRQAAELVTVSSCSSAGRRSYAGEGPVGLAWAFLRAGAKRVVASQWDVNDAATADVMDGMYGALAAGRAPAEALRQAKLQLVHSREKQRKPYYWAPFILYGAP